MSESKATGECLGSEFYVDGRWRFCVPDLDRQFESYEQMRGAIEASAKRIESAKKVKLSLPIVNDDCVPSVIVGVHAGHGRALLKPRIEVGYCGAYPDVQWIREAIDRRKALEQQVEDIKRVLNRFGMGIDNYSNDYGSSPEGLQKLYDGKLKAAEKTNLQKELARKVEDD